MSLPHHHLAAWQRADDLFIDIHALTQNVFPREERYELSSQLRRAAYSVPANIVEGTQRKFPKEWECAWSPKPAIGLAERSEGRPEHHAERSEAPTDGGEAAEAHGSPSVSEG